MIFVFTGLICPVSFDTLRMVPLTIRLRTRHPRGCIRAPRCPGLVTTLQVGRGGACCGWGWFTISFKEDVYLVRLATLAISSQRRCRQTTRVGRPSRHAQTWRCAIGKPPTRSPWRNHAPIDPLQTQRSGTIWLLQHFLEGQLSIGILCSLYVFVCFLAIWHLNSFLKCESI